jgi:hypothetical protein
VSASIFEKYPDYQLPMPQSATRAALLILAGGFLTILANMWPLFYSTGAIPMRAVILPRLIQLAMVCGWIYLLIGTAQRDRWLLVLRRSYTWKYVLLVCAILMIWTPATSTFKLLELLPDFQQYAVGWDQRDLTLSSLDQPVGTVYIDPLTVDIEDHLVLEKMIRESDPTDSFWVNACVTSYYGFERVYIKEPSVP